MLEIAPNSIPTQIATAPCDADEVKQVPIAHSGQIDFTTAGQKLLRQSPLKFDQLIDSLLDCATADEFVHQDIALLPNAKGAVGCLIFDGGVPPSIEMNDMRSRREIQAGATRLERQHEEGVRSSSWNSANQFLPLSDRRPAVQDKTGAAEHPGQQSSSGRGHFAELRENEQLFLSAGDSLGDLAQPLEFAAVSSG